MLKILAIAALLSLQATMPPVSGAVAAAPARTHVTATQNQGASHPVSPPPGLDARRKAWFAKAIDHLLDAR